MRALAALMLSAGSENPMDVPLLGKDVLLLTLVDPHAVDARIGAKPASVMCTSTVGA